MINSIVDVRRRLERDLGFDLPDKTWAYHVDVGNIDQVIEENWTIRELAEVVRDVWGAHGQPVPRKRDAPRMVSPGEKVKGVERSREDVISRLVAAEAGKDRDVIAFRRDVLGGSIVSPEQVEGWIKRRAKADGPPSVWLTVPVPPGREVRSTKDAATTEPPLTISQETPAILVQRQYLSYFSLLVPLLDDPTREVPTAEGGVLDRLRQLSEVLARHYGWDEALATNFVLTGEAPLVPAVEIGGSYPSNFTTLARITLTVDPALSPREVGDHYRHARDEIVGRRHRKLSEKHMRLATFSAERPAGESLRKRMAAWNRKYPDWRYKTETNFGRDCNQAIKRLLHPDYGPKIEV